MTDEQIVEAAKSAEKKTGFGELVHSQVSRGVNSAYGIGFLEGAKWAREQMMKEAVEGDIGMTLHDKRADLYVRSKGYLPESLGIKCNDKVRIIIVKED